MRAARVALSGERRLPACRSRQLAETRNSDFVARRCFDKVASNYRLAACVFGTKNSLRKYETIWDRTHWPISSVDSFFSYDFRAPLCSCCADRGGERLAIAENSFAGDRLHGVRAHGSHAFQSGR